MSAAAFHRDRAKSAGSRHSRRHNVFLATPARLTEHEAYALSALMQAVARLDRWTLDRLADGLLPIGEERRALPLACQCVADCLAANGWDAEKSSAI